MLSQKDRTTAAMPTPNAGRWRHFGFFLECKYFDASMPSQQMAERKRLSRSSYSLLSFPSSHHFLSFPCPCLPVSVGTAALPLSFSPSLPAVDEMSSVLKARKPQAGIFFTSAREVANRKGLPFSENSSITFNIPCSFSVYCIYDINKICGQLGLKNNPAASCCRVSSQLTFQIFSCLGATNRKPPWKSVSISKKKKKEKLVGEEVCLCEQMTAHLSVYVLPFIIGMSFQTPSPPTDVNCPRDVSRKKSGIPANTSVRKYGIRKAPAQIRDRDEKKIHGHKFGKTTSPDGSVTGTFMSL